MTIKIVERSVVTTITCDHEGCNEKLKVPWDKTFAIATARADGWSIGKQELCPKHRRGKQY